MKNILFYVLIACFCFVSPAFAQGEEIESPAYTEGTLASMFICDAGMTKLGTYHVRNDLHRRRIVIGNELRYIITILGSDPSSSMTWILAVGKQGVTDAIRFEKFDDNLKKEAPNLFAFFSGEKNDCVSQENTQ